MILKSSESGNEYITFKPTNVSDLPASIELGKEYAYKITGDLTVRGVKKSVTFNAKSVLKDANMLTGSADTTITYGDFGISVPDLPFLANVDKTTKLSVSIIATVK
jgi:polyisoprenoid-binding protein YceI